MPALLEPLRSSELRVFYARSEDVSSELAQQRCRAMLSEDERARHLRFHFEEDRHSYLAAHALTRGVLGRLLSVEPSLLRFRESERGRPELCWPEHAPTLRFNLSHTRGLSACAVALELDVGVDVEHVDRKVEIDQLAVSVFSDTERAALYALPVEQRRRRFFELWTLKESYIKAVGKGLSLPLGQIALDLDGASTPRIAFGPRIADRAERWSFALQPVLGGHMLAAALADPAPSAIAISELNPSRL